MKATWMFTDRWMWRIENTHDRVLLSKRREWNLAICGHMGGARGYDANWNISEKDKRFHLHVQSKKQTQRNKAEGESRIQRTNQRLPEGRRVEGCVKQVSEIKRVTLSFPNKGVTKIKCTAWGIQSIKYTVNTI